MSNADEKPAPPPHPKAIWGPARVWANDPTWCAVERGGNAQVFRDGGWVDETDPQACADIYQRALVETLDKRSMPLERAREITVACVANRMSVHTGGEYKPLPALSLEEMLVANRMAAEDPSYQGMTVDPRGIAAAYAFEQYGRSPEALLNAVGLTLADDDDEGDGGDDGDG